jgi:hypothetical protein
MVDTWKEGTGKLETKNSFTKEKFLLQRYKRTRYEDRPLQVDKNCPNIHLPFELSPEELIRRGI